MALLKRAFQRLNDQNRALRIGAYFSSASAVSSHLSGYGDGIGFSPQPGCRGFGFISQVNHEIAPQAKEPSPPAARKNAR
jgi:hypothetical protein